jgi:hypothetical protein
MARPDGVVVVSERYWAFAGRDGSLREGAMPRPPALARHIPLVRGLVKLGLSLSPLLRAGGVARRGERRLLLLALLAPLVAYPLPAPAGTIVAAATSAGLVLWMLRGRTLALHGAEHRAIAAAEEGRLVDTWSGAARPSRFSPRCGTNFAALVVPVTLLLQQLWPLPTEFFTPLAVAVASVAVSMELWRLVQRSDGGVLQVLLLPGLALQRLTTREPSLAETRVALTAAASVLRRELAESTP